MGSTGLGSISDLGWLEVWDRIGLEGAYTTMTRFILTFSDVRGRDRTAGSQSLPMNVLGNLDLTWREAGGSGRQRRASRGWCIDGERIVLTSRSIRPNFWVIFNASPHLQKSVFLTPNGFGLMR